MAPCGNDGITGCSVGATSGGVTGVAVLGTMGGGRNEGGWRFGTGVRATGGARVGRGNGLAKFVGSGGKGGNGGGVGRFCGAVSWAERDKMANTPTHASMEVTVARLVASFIETGRKHTPSTPC